jgi:hypothetical protein
MTTMLRKLCGFYIQDFDLIYERDTDPIDQFCNQHNVREQKEALGQLKDFREGVLAGKKTIRDLDKMGLGYFPSDDQDLEAWLLRVINYLGEKIANAERDRA